MFYDIDLNTTDENEDIIILQSFSTPDVVLAHLIYDYLLKSLKPGLSLFQKEIKLSLIYHDLDGNSHCINEYVYQVK